LISRPVFPSASGIAAAVALGFSDVFAKVILATGCSVLTMLTFRSVVGLGFMAVWLRFGPKPAATPRVRWIAIGVGVLFAVLIYCLFKAIEAIDVPTAVLTYFAYPLLTGIAASATGLERMRWQGVACAVAAFVGLAIMIGAHPAGLALAGIAYALAAACCRTGVLIVTRAFLMGAVSLMGVSWSLPQTSLGWMVMIALSFATTAGILLIFQSTVRIGPFRTALIMNLEPLIAMVLSAIVLGEVITPLQAAGSGVMLAALVAFQMWR
jgi:drug/metabolite transporter (DMT)-like permease